MSSTDDDDIHSDNSNPQPLSPLGDRNIFRHISNASDARSSNAADEEDEEHQPRDSSVNNSSDAANTNTSTTLSDVSSVSPITSSRSSSLASSVLTASPESKQQQEQKPAASTDNNNNNTTTTKMSARARATAAAAGGGGAGSRRRSLVVKASRASDSQQSARGVSSRGSRAGVSSRGSVGTFGRATRNTDAAIGIGKQTKEGTQKQQQQQQQQKRQTTKAQTTRVSVPMTRHEITRALVRVQDIVVLDKTEIALEADTELQRLWFAHKRILAAKLRRAQRDKSKHGEMAASHQLVLDKRFASLEQAEEPTAREQIARAERQHVESLLRGLERDLTEDVEMMAHQEQLREKFWLRTLTLIMKNEAAERKNGLFQEAHTRTQISQQFEKEVSSHLMLSKREAVDIAKKQQVRKVQVMKEQWEKSYRQQRPPQAARQTTTTTKPSAASSKPARRPSQPAAAAAGSVEPDSPGVPAPIGRRGTVQYAPGDDKPTEQQQQLSHDSSGGILSMASSPSSSPVSSNGKISSSISSDREEPSPQKPSKNITPSRPGGKQQQQHSKPSPTKPKTTTTTTTSQQAAAAATAEEDNFVHPVLHGPPTSSTGNMQFFSAEELEKIRQRLIALEQTRRDEIDHDEASARASLSGALSHGLIAIVEKLEEEGQKAIEKSLHALQRHFADLQEKEKELRGRIEADAESGRTFLVRKQERHAAVEWKKFEENTVRHMAHEKRLSERQRRLDARRAASLGSVASGGMLRSGQQGRQSFSIANEDTLFLVNDTSTIDVIPYVAGGSGAGMKPKPPTAPGSYNNSDFVLPPIGTAALAAAGGGGGGASTARDQQQQQQQQQRILRSRGGDSGISGTSSTARYGGRREFNLSPATALPPAVARNTGIAGGSLVSHTRPTNISSSSTTTGFNGTLSGTMTSQFSAGSSSSMMMGSATTMGAQAMANARIAVQVRSILSLERERRQQIEKQERVENMQIKTDEGKEVGEYPEFIEDKLLRARLNRAMNDDDKDRNRQRAAHEDDMRGKFMAVFLDKEKQLQARVRDVEAQEKNERLSEISEWRGFMQVCDYFKVELGRLNRMAGAMHAEESHHRKQVEIDAARARRGIVMIISSERAKVHGLCAKLSKLDTVKQREEQRQERREEQRRQRAKEVHEQFASTLESKRRATEKDAATRRKTAAEQRKLLAQQQRRTERQLERESETAAVAARRRKQAAVARQQKEREEQQKRLVAAPPKLHSNRGDNSKKQETAGGDDAEEYYEEEEEYEEIEEVEEIEEEEEEQPDQDDDETAGAPERKTSLPFSPSFPDAEGKFGSGSSRSSGGDKKHSVVSSSTADSKKTGEDSSDDDSMKIGSDDDEDHTTANSAAASGAGGHRFSYLDAIGGGATHAPSPHPPPAADDEEEL